jgi:hypothetical protein
MIARSCPSAKCHLFATHNAVFVYLTYFDRLSRLALEVETANYKDNRYIYYFYMPLLISFRVFILASVGEGRLMWESAIFS